MPHRLVSHALCPYVQRAAIALYEKHIPFERVTVDLADKPAWFLAISPLGKTPVLDVDGTPIFESNVILEYVEETEAHPLHPLDPLQRALHRGWMEVASAILNDIAGFYNAPDRGALIGKAERIAAIFTATERALSDRGPYFAGLDFSLVDAAFAPVFRYFDSFDAIEDFGFWIDRHRLCAWRSALARRASVIHAVDTGYPAALEAFLASRRSYLATLIKRRPNSP